MYTEVLYDLNLMQLITHKAGNILNVILTNYDFCKNNDIHSNLPPGLTSDHYNYNHLSHCTLPQQASGRSP